MSAEKMREEFEAWAAGMRYSTKTDNLGYCHPETTRAWRIWHASRAALVVQLPKVELMAGDDGVESEIMCPRAVVKAIEAAGVKVAP